MITLEDIPEAIAKDFDWTPRSQIAAILNAAIEAGIVARRVPDADDPRVLRRALEIALKSWDDDRATWNVMSWWIDKARRELESEGKDGA